MSTPIETSIDVVAPALQARRPRASADWRVKRLRFALSLNPSWREAARLNDEDEVAFVPMEAVGEFGGLDLTTTKPMGEIGSGYTYFADGDVVVAKITPCFENGKGALARNLRNGVAFGTTELHVLRANPAELHPEYLFYVSISQPFRAFGESSMYGAGGQKRVPEEFVKNLRWPVPPLSDQRAIASFLHRETARIDALIEKKRRLIELLQEKRVAVIAQAVTRGLDATAPLKDSRSSWIGQIPRHWEVCRVKLVARLESGHTPSRSVPEYWEDCDIPWVSLNDSKQLSRSDYISETAVSINKRGLDNSSARILPTDAVVFTRDATIGLAAITTRPMAVSQHLIAWIPGPRINSRFLLRVFNAMKPFLDAYTFGATIKTIGMPDVKKLVTPVPPLAEQVAIADALDRTTRYIDHAVEKTQVTIDRLAEYRSAIVTAAVTGQIDVREAA